MRGGGGGSRARQNTMRSGVVVVGGAVAFGYLSFHVGFKPYLDLAQQARHSHNSASAAAAGASDSAAAQPDHPGSDLAPSKDPAVVLRD